MLRTPSLLLTSVITMGWETTTARHLLAFTAGYALSMTPWSKRMWRDWREGKNDKNKEKTNDLPRGTGAGSQHSLKDHTDG